MFAEPFVAANVVEFVVDERIGVTSLNDHPLLYNILNVCQHQENSEPSNAVQLCKRLAVPKYVLSVSLDHPPIFSG